MKRITEYNFRQLQHRCLVLTDDPLVERVKDLAEFPCQKSDNALLLYGYIDHECGLSFELLALAQVAPGRDIAIRESKANSSVKIRINSLTGTLAEHPSSAVPQSVAQKIALINEGYRPHPDLAELRDFEAIDSLRHPRFPDDIQVRLLEAKGNTEVVWCRLEARSDDGLVGKLLNSPLGKFGVKMGDTLKLILLNNNGEIIALALL